MRTTLSRWTAIAVVSFSAVSITGCQSTNWGFPSQNWLSWNKKAPSSGLATKPSSNFLPSPTSTLANNGTGTGTNAATGGSPSYPATGQPSANYGYQQTSATQPGYYTGPYGTGATGANAAGQPPAGSRGYAGAPSNSSPYGGSPSSANGTGNAGYGSANSGTDGYRTADQRNGYGTPGAANPNAGTSGSWNADSRTPANASPAPAGWNGSGTNYNGGNPSYAGAASGYSQPTARPAIGQPASPWSTPPAGHDGHDHGAYAENPATRPASQPRDGGYRPGSTGRVKPIDNTWRPDDESVQPAAFNRTPQNNGAYTEESASQPSAGSANGTYSPPAGSYQP